MLNYLLAVAAITTAASAGVIQKPLNPRKDTLVLLHVLFRHGNRTSDDASAIYPADPYKDYDFYPYGRGELTNEGKRTEYSIGQALRHNYGKFLGDTYTPDVLYAQSTAYNRTKMSLQLVLASLYPPKNTQVWNRQLSWQPIPYSYAPLDDDPLLFGINTKKFQESYVGYLLTPEYVGLISQYADLLSYVSENVGTICLSFMDVFRIYDTLKTESEFGLPLPEWAKSVYPDELAQAGTNVYSTFVATRELKQATAGCLLSKIASDTTDKINGNGQLENKKLFLYSAHDVNVATFLMTLGLYEHSSGMPPYGSYVVLEVHNIDGDYGIQIRFQNYTQAEPLLLTLPGCTNPCPVNDFIRLTEEYYPTPSECNN